VRGNESLLKLGLVGMLVLILGTFAAVYLLRGSL
jgi:hypothetical protein